MVREVRETRPEMSSLQLKHVVEGLLGQLDPARLIHFRAEREPRLHCSPGCGLKLTGLSELDQRSSHFDRELHDNLSEPEDHEDLSADRQTVATKRLLPTNAGPTDEVVGETLLGAVGSVDYWSCSLTT